jgi:DNA-binding transcriptional MerR regulator
MTEELVDALREVPAGIAVRKLDVTHQTLRNWAAKGLIKAKRSGGGRYLYDLAGYYEQRAKGEKAA